MILSCVSKEADLPSGNEAEEFDELQHDAVENVAGYLCHKLKDKISELPVTTEQKQSLTWVDHVSEGGLCKPSREFVEKVCELERIFKKTNGDLICVRQNYIKNLMEEAENVDCAADVKKLFFRSRMYFSVRKLNAQIRSGDFQRKRKINKTIT